MNELYLDIETGSLPSGQLREVLPNFTAPSNYKDPAKIAASIAEQEATWLDRAALKAETGQILAVGVRRKGQTDILAITSDLKERELILFAWSQWKTAYNERCRIIGHNIIHFDIPYLCRRSVICGLSVPGEALNACESRYVSHRTSGVYDTMLRWSLGQRDRESFISLDTLGWALGAGRKNGSGADFAAKLMLDRAAAIAYLQNDLALLEKIYHRLSASGL